MALAPGTRLGPYVISTPLGSGGMGEVYKATDTRLNRTVAVKVLPEHVASDPDLKQRFEREAQTLAALSHPHICPVFDVGSQGSIDFLVMEYLEGETLEQRLKKGALPLNQALQFGIQIADALAAAHRAGIVHRDLKPGNVMLTKSGAKLLDFGLAKTSAPAVAGSLSMLPTTPPGQTQRGAILGTFQYMLGSALRRLTRENRRSPNVVTIAAVAVAIGLLPLPYGYYMLLRLFLCGVSLYFLTRPQRTTEQLGADRPAWCDTAAMYAAMHRGYRSECLSRRFRYARSFRGPYSTNASMVKSHCSLARPRVARRPRECALSWGGDALTAQRYQRCTRDGHAAR